MITDGVQGEKISPLSPAKMLAMVPMDDEKGKKLPVSHVKPPIRKKAEEGEYQQCKGGLRTEAPLGPMSCICWNCRE
jgi:hypothetical protein